jgi:APA family basic amino acid/polyamine antiporter
MSDPSKSRVQGPRTLQRSIRPTGFFVLVFGQMVGSGWVVVLGAWLAAAGPGGAVLGFVAGGTAMLLVCACYCELAARLPKAEGEILYVDRAFGPRASFLLAWFLTIYYIALSTFEGIALTWLLGELFPALRGGVVYVAFGEPVTSGSIVVGLGGLLLVSTLNYCGAAVTVLIQRIITYSFITLSLLLIAVGTVRGHISSLSPLFHASAGSSWQAGALWIFASCTLFVSGFQVICYTVEERHTQTSLRGVAGSALVAVLAGTAFYSGIVLAAGSARPWQTLLDRPLPAVAAFGSLTANGWLGTIVLVAATVSLAKTWNSLVIAASRLLFGQARLGFLPAALGAIHPRFRSPYIAVMTVGTLSFAGILLGRGAVLPILNMGALCVSLTFATCLCALLRLRHRTTDRPEFQVPGGSMVVASTILIVLFMASGLIWRAWTAAAGGVPLEITLIGIWAAAGIVVLAIRGITVSTA